MSSHRALVVIAGLVFSVAAQAQQPAPPPPLLFTGQTGRPSVGQVFVLDTSSTQDDLVHTPVVMQPKPGTNESYVIVEIKGGLPIVLALPAFPAVNPAQSAQGDLVGPDENDDFVVVSNDNIGSGTVTVFAGTNGTWDGSVVTPLLTLVETTDISANVPNPTLVATLNVDGVAPDEIIVGNASGSHVFFRGPNAFPSQPTYSFSMPNLRDIAIGNVNLDGHDDFALAAGAGSGGSVDVYRYQEGTGYVSACSLTNLPAVASVELVDLDHVGGDDLVVALHLYSLGAPYQGKVRVYFNTTGSTPFYNPGSYTEYTRFSSTGTLPTFGAAADVDGDGDLDMVYTQTDSIAYPSANFAQYNPPVMLLHIVNNLSGSPSQLEFTMRGTRFTGKAVDPILVSVPGNGVVPGPLQPGHLLLSWSADKGAGVTNADEEGVQSYGVGGDGTADGTSVQFEVPKIEAFLTGQIPGDGATADVALDNSMAAGALDIVVPNLGPNSLTVALGDGQGGFADRSVVTGIATPPSGYIGGPRGVVLTDLTGDGFADAVVDSDFMKADDWKSVITLLHSNTTGLVKVEELALEHSGELAVADIDGDGHKDVIVTRRLGKDPPHDIEVHFGGPGGKLDPRRAPYAVGLNLSPAGLTGGLAVGDVDGDGDVDIVVSYARLILPAGPIEPGVVAFVNDWASHQNLRPVPSAFPAGSFVPDVESLVLGDVNGTAARDVAVGLRDGTLWYARGAGVAATFALQTIDAESAQTGGGNLTMAHLDRDSRMDIVSCTGWPAQQSVVQLLYASQGNDFDVHELAPWNPEDYDGATRPIVGDFTGDGVPDVAIVHSIGEVTILPLP